MKLEKKNKKNFIVINSLFNKKKELEITLKNNSKKILRNFKLCFSLIYSIHSINNALVLKQVGRYYELIQLKNDYLKSRNMWKIKICFKKENINFINRSSGIEGVFVLDKNQKKINVKINELKFIKKIKDKSYASIRNQFIDMPVIPNPYNFKFNKKILDCSKGFYITNKKILKSFLNVKKIIGKNNYLKNNKSGIKIYYINKLYGKEEYKIFINNDNIVIISKYQAGIFYSLVTLCQMLIINKGKIKQGFIKDKPRFSWRGMHLDCARQFYPKEKIKKLLDFMALFKLNRFHWHFTDNEAWRLDLDCYPELAKKLSFRGYHNIVPPTYGGGIGPKGGLYSKKDIKEIILYANNLSIKIMPEIDIPAHSWALMNYMNELNEKEDQSWINYKGIYSNNTLNPGLKFTWIFLKKIFKEISKRFPFPIIHIGFDERPKNSWSKSPSVKKLMKINKFNKLSQVQNYFINKVQKILLKYNKKTALWNDGLNSYYKNPINKDCIIFAWENFEKGIIKAKNGYKVVLGPAEYCYFDMAYSNSYFDRGLKWAGTLETKKVFEWEPVPKKLHKISSKILGIQGHLWSETITNINLMDIMINPRLIALSEVAWSNNKRDWPLFRNVLMKVIKITKNLSWDNHRF